jgi:hypothetical protein
MSGRFLDFEIGIELFVVNVGENLSKPFFEPQIDEYGTAFIASN